MAVTVTDDRTIINEADATTGWTGSVTISTGTADPAPIESTGWLGQRNNNTTTDAYVTITSANYTNVLVYAWIFPRTVLDTRTNGGACIQLGDGTNRVAYHLAGDDVAAFRHDSGPAQSWQCMVLDTAKLASYSATVKAGSRATLEGNLANITQVGIQFKGTVGAQGNVPNVYWDIMRRASTGAGTGLTITGGTSGDPGTFDQIATEDRNTGNQRAHGVLRKLGTGAYGCQGVLRFGNATGSSSSWFEDKNVSLIFEDRGLDTDKYRIDIVDNGTGTTTFKLGVKVGTGTSATGEQGAIIVVPTGVGGIFDANTDTDVTDVFIYGSTFSGFTNGVRFRSGHEFIGGIISGSGQVIADGATMVNSKILGSTVAADASALRWNVATDPDTYLHGMTFSKGTNAHHAIELGTTSPTTMTLRNIVFTGFNTSNAQNDSVLHVKRTTGTVTINLVGCVGTVSYKTDGATVSLVIDPVATTITVRDSINSEPVPDARVLVYAADNSGPLPANESVSITRSGSTATVTHTAHNIPDGSKVLIKGANQTEYNGVFTITVINSNSYSYTITGAPATPATGTILATGVVIQGTTNESGVIQDVRSWSASQPVVGRVRRASALPAPPSIETTALGSFDSNSDKLTQQTDVPATLKTAYTICGWFKRTSNASQSLLLTPATASNSYNTIFVTTAGEVKVGSNLGSSAAILTISLNTWYFFALTQSGSTRQLTGYVGGAQAGTIYSGSTTSIDNADAVTNLYVGGGNVFGDQHVGSLTEVRVWNIEMTAAQIEAERDGWRTPANTINLIGRYPLVDDTTKLSADVGTDLATTGAGSWSTDTSGPFDSVNPYAPPGILYKTAPIAGTINNTAGLDITVQMIRDE